MKYTYKQLKEVFEKKGYKFYDEGDFNLNIFGVRNPSRTPNKFDDIVGVAYREGGQEKVVYFKATTDPGLYWLQNPMVARGTAIMVPGQYRSAYAIGKHRGYNALTQVGKIQIVIDADRDKELDFDSTKFETGLFAINIHRAHPEWESQLVDKWSAGCQVIASPDDFDALMVLAGNGTKLHGERFTYTLLEQKDLD